MKIFLLLSFLFFRANNAQTNCPAYENDLLPDFDAENAYIVRANPERDDQCLGIPQWAEEDVRKFLTRNFDEESVEAEPSKFSRTSGGEVFALLIAKQSQDDYNRLTREADAVTDLMSSLKTSITKAKRTYPWLSASMIYNELKLCLASPVSSGGDSSFDYDRERSLLANVSSYSVKCSTLSHKAKQARYIMISILAYTATYTPDYDLVWVQAPLDGSRLENQVESGESFSVTLRPEREGRWREGRQKRRVVKDYDYLARTLVPCARDLDDCRRRADGYYATNFDLLQVVFSECQNRAGFTSYECYRKIPMSQEQKDRLYLLTELVPCATQLRSCHRERQRYYPTKFDLIKDLMLKCMEIDYSFEDCSDYFRLGRKQIRKLRNALPKNAETKIEQPEDIEEEIVDSDEEIVVKETTHPTTPSPTTTESTTSTTTTSTTSTTTTTTTTSLVQVKRYKEMTFGEKRLIKAATRRRAVAFVRENYRHFF